MRVSKSSFALTALLLGFLLILFSQRVNAQNARIPARVTQAIDEKNLVTLKGNVHPLARPEFDQGPVADALPMKRILLLLRRSTDQETSLQQLLEEQTKSSPNYHAWLRPEQFGMQFGITDADLATVTSWLTSQGFSDIKVGPGRTVMEFSGNAGQVRSAFHTEIHSYLVEGEKHVANASDPQIPAALAPVVTGIVSLHNFPKKSHAKFLGLFRRTIGKPGLEPLFTFPNPQNGMNFYGLGPGDFATIYNTTPLLTANPKIDGTGQTVAIVGETNINVADVQAFRKMFSLPANYDATNVILNGEDPGITSKGEEGEADLDNEWSGAAAPGATIKFVVSASTPASAGIDLSALYIVENNLAGVMSESYGQCESALGAAGNAFYNSLWQQAAAQGITVILSSGDGGSAGCDDFDTEQVAKFGLAVSGLASTPFNVSVGGTDFDEVNTWATYWNSANDATGSSAKSYIPEIPWNENCAQIALTGCGASAPNGSLNIVAGSGGQSSVYSKPKWQMGVTGMPNDSHRDQPDVSLFASPGFNGTGYVYCQSDQTISGTATCDLNTSTGTLDFGIVGGTSAAAPAFAGIMALVNQKQSTPANPAPRQGSANYVLYGLAKKSGASCTSSATEASTCIFNDIVAGNSYIKTRYGSSVGTNSVPCQGGTPNCSVSIAGSNGVLVDPSHPTTEAWTAAAGYDMASGLGSVNANNLATNWGSVSTVPTTTTLSLSPTTGITHGTAENVTVNISVAPKSGTATGDVSLLANINGTTQGLDQFTLGANGSFSGKTQSLPGGTSYQVYAHYAGDGTNAPSDSTPVTVTVGQEPSQSFIVIPTFDSQGNLLSGNATSVTYGSNYIIRMYVTDKNGVASTSGPPSPTCYQENVLTCPSGTVTLTDGGALLGTGGAGSGVYNLNNFGYTRDLTPALIGGTHSLAAKYSGDVSYQTSISLIDTLTITPASTALSVYSTWANPLAGTPFQINVSGCPNVSGGVAPTGTLSLFDGTSLIGGPVPVTGSGCANGNPGLGASFQVTLNTGGDHNITAQYSGDASYATSTSSPIVVHPLYPTTMTVTPSATTINYGQSVTITANIVSTGKSPAMTGTLSFNGSYTPINGPVTTTPGTDAKGNQTLTATVTTTPQFSEYVYVSYTGDSNFGGAFATSSTITVNIPDFTLGPASGISVVPMAGQTGSGQITITPTSQTPSTVNLSLQNTVSIPGYTVSLSPQQVSLNGLAATATLSLTSTVPVPAAVIRNVRHAGFFIAPGSTWRSLSVVTGLAALFLIGFSSWQKRYRAALGLVVMCLVCIAIGCGGGSTGGGPPPPPAGPTTTTLTTSNAKVDQNSQFTITATVTGSNPLTGTVTFYDNGNQIFSPNIPLTNGQVQATNFGYVYGLGVHQFMAKYSGDTSDLPSTSSVLTQVVTGTTTVNIQGNTGGDVHYLQATIGVQ